MPFAPANFAFGKAPVGRRDFTGRPRFVKFFDPFTIPMSIDDPFIAPGAAEPGTRGWGAQYLVSRWGVFGSDSDGTVLAAFANGMLAGTRIRAAAVVARNAAPPEPHTDDIPEILDYTDAGIRADFRRLTGGLTTLGQPSTTAVDVNVATALEHWRTEGLHDCLGRKQRIVGYLHVKPRDQREMTMALKLFGWAAVGLTISKRLIREIKKADAAGHHCDPFPVWTAEHRRSARAGLILAAVIGMDGDGNYLLAAWGRLYTVSPSYFGVAADEAWVVITKPMLTGEQPIPGFQPAAFAKEALAMAAGGQSRIRQADGGQYLIDGQPIPALGTRARSDNGPNIRQSTDTTKYVQPELPFAGPGITVAVPPPPAQMESHSLGLLDISMPDNMSPSPSTR